MLLDHCYCPYFRTILKYVHHFANIAKKNGIIQKKYVFQARGSKMVAISPSGIKKSP